MDLPIHQYQVSPMVQTPYQTVNGVQVAPSENYDLSRGLVGTPVKPYVGNPPKSTSQPLMSQSASKDVKDSSLANSQTDAQGGARPVAVLTTEQGPGDLLAKTSAPQASTTQASAVAKFEDPDPANPPVVFRRHYKLQAKRLDPNNSELLKQLDCCQKAPSYQLKYKSSAQEKSPANLAVTDFIQGLINTLANRGMPVYSVVPEGNGDQFYFDEKHPITIEIELDGQQYVPFTLK